MIGRQAIEADVAAQAVQLDLPLRRIVALLAQPLQRAGDEVGPVALVRLDMTGYVGWPPAATPALRSELAQSLFFKVSREYRTGAGGEAYQTGDLMIAPARLKYSPVEEPKSLSGRSDFSLMTGVLAQLPQDLPHERDGPLRLVVHSPLMSAALMIGHHFSISVFW